MNPLFTVAEIIAVTGGRLLQGSPQTPVSGFAYDSRKVRPGDCFVAMRGERVDGHDFARGAVEAGAACILAGRALDVAIKAAGEDPVEGTGAAVVVAADPLLALGQLGRRQRDRFEIPVVAVSGSVGKTTTKEMVAAVLSRRFDLFKSMGNLNSEVGLPITLMGLRAHHQAAVLEMGMRAPGEIAYLMSIARPTVGVVTNVGLSHLELLGTVANIARAKAELVLGLPEDGVAVLNSDDPLVAAMAADAPSEIWSYGFKAPGNSARWVSVRDVRREGETGQRALLVTSAGDAEWFVPAPGEYNLLNAMAAAAVGLALGMELSEVAEGIEGYSPSGSRMRLVKVGGVRVLDDSYNAAPASVLSALKVMREFAGAEGRCIAVLGDMFELGPAAVAGHRAVGDEAGRLADLVIAVGELSKQTADAAGSKATYYPSKAGAIAHLTEELRPGDTVLVKGSRGMAMEEIVQAVTKHLQV